MESNQNGEAVCEFMLFAAWSSLDSFCILHSLESKAHGLVIFMAGAMELPFQVCRGFRRNMIRIAGRNGLLVNDLLKF
jgi:hypothetical protein